MPGPGMGCAVRREGSGCRLRCGVGCTSVLGCRLDARGRGSTAVQSLSKAADWLESPICPFLKGAACKMGIL